MTLSQKSANVCSQLSVSLGILQDFLGIPDCATNIGQPFQNTGTSLFRPYEKRETELMEPTRASQVGIELSLRHSGFKRRRANSGLGSMN